jgi:transcriptional regulator with XRE-family HTH domain
MIPSSPAPNIVGLYISRARTSAGVTQQELGERLATSKQWVSDIERGTRTPSPETVVRLHRALLPDDADSGKGLTLWLGAAAVQRALRGKLSHEEVSAAVASVAFMESALSSERKPTTAIGRTLARFPSGFGDVVVVIGDRRESPPRSRADLLAHSLSAGDVRFLLDVGLERSVPIISDKVFALMDDEHLRARFAKNTLLIIGSPAVNLLARRVNRDTLFHFALPLAAGAMEAQLRTLQHLSEDETLLRAASMMLKDTRLIAARAIGRGTFDQDPTVSSLTGEQIHALASALKRTVLDPLTRGTCLDERYPPDLDGILDMFRKTGIVDPVAQTTYRDMLQPNQDLGLVSVGPNPFADRNDAQYACVAVAGVHGPGTAQALKMLGRARGEYFAERPFGGVIRVTLDKFKDWPTRFDHATPEWVTPAYTVQELSKLLGRTPDSSRSAEDQVSETCKDFVACQSSHYGLSLAAPSGVSQSAEEL